MGQSIARDIYDMSAQACRLPMGPGPLCARAAGPRSRPTVDSRENADVGSRIAGCIHNRVKRLLST